MQIAPGLLADVLHQEGLTDEEITTFLAISRGESTYYYNAVNQNKDKGDDSWGLFQINFRKGAAGKERAKKLGIPISQAFDGEDELPSTEDLAEYFLLEKDDDGNWVVQEGVTENQLIERNLEALGVVWTNVPSIRNGNRSYAAWSVHPDSDAYRKSAKDSEVRRNWSLHQKFVEENFFDEYGEWGYEYQPLGSSQSRIQPEDSHNRGVNTPTWAGPSEREIKLENEWHSNKGNDFRQRQIIQEILEERMREGYPHPIEPDSAALGIAKDQGLVDRESNIGDPLPILAPEYTDDYEFLRNNPDGDVEFNGEIWNIVELLEAERDRELGIDNWSYFEASDPRYLLWVQSLYEQTQHFFESEQGRAGRESNWYASGKGDEYTDRRLNLIEKYVTKVEKIFSDGGVIASETEVLDFARDAWLAGWSDDAIRDALSEREDMEFGADAPVASEINATRQDINSLYRQYLVDPDPDVISEANRRLWRGETDLENIEAGLASQSADLYPAWADRIEAGRTPLAILGSYNSIFKSVMGYMPEWDGVHQTVGMQLGSGEGNMSGANFARYLRGTEEYDMTPNAINAAYNLVGDIGRTMGVMA